MLEAFSTLVGQIYDTILFPETWSTVLTDLTNYVGATRSLLILEDAIDPSKSRFNLSFDDPEWVGRYLHTYLLLNPMRLAMTGHVEAGTVILTSDFMTVEEYARSRFAREFLAMRDIVDVSAVVLESTATTISVLSFVRSSGQGYADEQVRRKLELLGPHVRRAASVSRVLNREGLEAASLSDFLDKLDGAVFLLDESGIIVHSNRGARTLLSEHPNLLGTLGNRLWPVSAAARSTLTDALAKAAGGDRALGSDGIAINFGSSAGMSWVGSVVSLADGSRRSLSAPYRAAAALFVREIRFELPVSRDALTSLYGLTRREVTIAAGIMEFGGIPATASVLGLGTETVRTHLRSIFRKTGTSRQADLVQLLVRAASPFKR